MLVKVGTWLLERLVILHKKIYHQLLLVAIETICVALKGLVYRLILMNARI